MIDAKIHVGESTGHAVVIGFIYEAFAVLEVCNGSEDHFYVIHRRYTQDTGQTVPIEKAIPFFPTVDSINKICNWFARESKDFTAGSKVNTLFYNIENNDIIEVAPSMASFFPPKLAAEFLRLTNFEFRVHCIGTGNNVNQQPLDSRQKDVVQGKSDRQATKTVPVAIAMATNSQQQQKTKKDKKMADTSKKNTMVLSHIKQGAQVGLADEAGTVILQFVDETSGGRLAPYMATEEGAALVKLVAATLLLHGIDFVTDDAATRANVEAGCGLVIQAASRDVLQPRMAELRKVGLNLGRVGSKARLSATTEE